MASKLWWRVSCFGFFCVLSQSAGWAQRHIAADIALVMLARLPLTPIQPRVKSLRGVRRALRHLQHLVPMATAAGRNNYDFDLFTIGAGSGGVRCSRLSANYGAKVAVCEMPIGFIASDSHGGAGGTCVIRVRA